ncbi:MAG: histidine phosphatase family protein [Roseibium sp.]|uniref:histidine phosphatase family protein n=1 Tax=Roseibium sp. TaxID=1936156 RepID=UPI003D9C278B
MSERFAILLRHGAYHQKPGAPSALQPYGLTETGLRQAAATAKELAGLAEAEGWRFDPVIVCSRQQRAWQTAATLAAELAAAAGHPFQTLEDETLAERSVGAFANLTASEIEDILAQDPRYGRPPENWKSDSHYTLPAQGAESLMEAGARVADCLSLHMDRLSEASGPNARIFVGHGASLRHAAHHLGVLEFEDIRRLSMHHARPVVLKRTQEGTWHHHCGSWKQRQLLDTALD